MELCPGTTWPQAECVEAAVKIPRVVGLLQGGQWQVSAAEAGLPFGRVVMAVKAMGEGL